MERHPEWTAQKLWQAARAALMLARVLSVLVATLPSQAQTLTVLHNFTGPDGIGPHGALLFDDAGNLYGTTMQIQGGSAGLGSVFKLDPSGDVSVLYIFNGAPDGAYPSSGLVRDTAGNLYGTTNAGGNVANCPYPRGCGIVFKLDPNGTETVLHRFGSGSDGLSPVGLLALDSAGNLYGTTLAGGGTRCQRYIGTKLVDVGCGTVFKIDASGQESVLHPLAITDGAFPSAGLVRDTAGNLFGTANQGGLQNCTFSVLGCGTVFKVDTTGQFSVLYSFKGPEAGPDGAYPQAGLTLDPQGNLYSTTAAGGSATGCPSLAQGENCGTIFQLTPAGKETVLYSFKATAGAAVSGLVRDAAGNLYGLVGGTVFKLDPSGTKTDLYTFTGNDAGLSDDLVLDANGNLYGVTPHGSSGFGTVFKLTTPEDFAVPAFTLTPASVSPGMPASATLNLAAISGFTDTVAFTCSVSPKPTLAPQCSVTPASAAPGTPVTVKVTSTGPSARLSSHSGLALSYAMWLPLLGLAGIGNRLGSKQRKTKAMLLGCVLVAGLLFQVACGGSSSMTGSSGTPPGAYTITVTGTSSAASGSLVRSTSTTLQVQ
jgi:uncharacterized repeat protein (TIGR03803 family)